MNRHDIDDDEIRVISSKQTPKKSQSTLRPKKKNVSIIVFSAICVLVLLVVGLYINYEPVEEAMVPTPAEELPTPTEEPHPHLHDYESVAEGRQPSVEISDTISNGARLTIIEPHDAIPALSVGLDALKDSAVILLFQAADVRADNGEIAGAFVVRGQLISKGQPKSGFCAIIAGTPIIGVAASTPYLEEALDTEGYFFRQYPLVVAGQVVENKPKGRAHRKALAEIDGKTVVIIGKNRLTFHDFSQALADIGVNNAIYLVGGESYSKIRMNSGEVVEHGKLPDPASKNINFIVWR
ncbi:MAG: phosphodiester glycosidase family protein [Muribaculaceae bacterium]|nr:phosphodiester glycosidase family protein [Muribaculaceae bacterium]